MMEQEVTKKKMLKIPRWEWPMVKDFFADVFRIFFVQLVQSFTINNLLNIGITVLISILQIIIALATGNTAQYENAENVNRLFIRIIVTGVVLALLSSSVTTLRDKATLDKNRVAYLLYGKQSIALGKVTGGTLQFAIQVTLIYVLTVALGAAGGFNLSGQDVGKIIVYIIGATAYYTMIQTGTRYIVAGCSQMWLRAALLALWAAVTIVFYLVASVVNLVESTGTKDFFIGNMKWVAFVPLMNVALIDIMVSGDPSLAAQYDNWNQIWPVLIMAAECVIICAVVWKPFSGKLKTYLTT